MAQRDAEPEAAPWASALLTAVLADRHAMLLVKRWPDGAWLHADAGFRRWAGLGVDEPGSDARVFEGAVIAALRAAEQTAVAHGAALAGEHRFERHGQRQHFLVVRLAGEPAADGSRWVASAWFDVMAERRREQQLQAVLTQLEDQQRANEALRRELADQALRDPATGLYGRTNFDDQLKREVDLSQREHREFALVFIEIDALGAAAAAAGDEGHARILAAMGRLLRGGTRAMDASCRLDAQRFSVLLSGVGLATAHSRMEGLRRQCAQQIVAHAGSELSFTVSIGVASFPHTASSQERLVEAGESALRHAQARGGNQVALAAIPFGEA